MAELCWKELPFPCQGSASRLKVHTHVFGVEYREGAHQSQVFLWNREPFYSPGSGHLIWTHVTLTWWSTSRHQLINPGGLGVRLQGPVEASPVAARQMQAVIQDVGAHLKSLTRSWAKGWCLLHVLNQAYSLLPSFMCFTGIKLCLNDWTHLNVCMSSLNTSKIRKNTKICGQLTQIILKYLLMFHFYAPRGFVSKL